MFNFIIFMVIIYFVIIKRVISKKRELEQNNGGSQSGPARPVSSGTTRTVQRNSVQRSSVQRSSVQRSSVQSRTIKSNSMPVKSSVVLAEDNPDIKTSTMDYLKEKADQNKAYDSSTEKSASPIHSYLVGRRLPDSGIAPANEQMIICGYCGAENLLPRGVRAKNYNCYFCREKLN